MPPKWPSTLLAHFNPHNRTWLAHNTKMLLILLPITRFNSIVFTSSGVAFVDSRPSMMLVPLFSSTCVYNKLLIPRREKVYCCAAVWNELFNNLKPISRKWYHVLSAHPSRKSASTPTPSSLILKQNKKLLHSVRINHLSDYHQCHVETTRKWV